MKVQEESNGLMPKRDLDLLIEEKEKMSLFIIA